MTRSTRLLLMALMMFPQIVETLYSPILPALTDAFAISEYAAGQTLSFYFIAFAFGIVLWGYLCDLLGRRITFIIALLLYAVGAVATLWATEFSTLLICRMVMAFSAAIGSIGTQTVMRDVCTGEELRKTFAIIGIALSISPMMGIFMGTWLEMLFNYRAVFVLLVIFAVLLLTWTWLSLPETRSTKPQASPLLPLIATMLKDRHLRCNMFLIAGFNIAMFSYYQLAPFWFTAHHHSMADFSYTGIIIGGGSLCGALINRHYIKHGCSAPRLIRGAIVLLLMSAILACLLIDSLWLLLPIFMMTTAYGIGIPNILSIVLKDYQHALGTAGALLGLGYYSLLGMGLIFSALSQHIGYVLLITASLMLYINLSE